MKSIEIIINEDGLVMYISDFISFDLSEDFFHRINNTTNWLQQEIKIFGRMVPMPRLTAWYGDKESRYTYSGLDNNPQPWLPVLLELKQMVEAYTGLSFNSVLLNLYRNGDDAMGWHRDNEKELGQNPEIVSLSFGAPRNMRFKHAVNKEKKEVKELTPGSLLWMRGATQHHWYHCIPRTAKVASPRINLTFRTILTK